mgnify:CR=1 FL=1
MSYYYSYLTLHDVADKVGVLGLVGAVAAGLAAFALLAGVAQLKRKAMPRAYPGDAEALQTKYLLAFKQLKHGGSISLSGETSAAEHLASDAFKSYSEKSDAARYGAIKR